VLHFLLLLLPLLCLLWVLHLPAGVSLLLLQSWPLSRLSSEGVAMFGLAAAADGGMFRDALVKFFVPNKALPFHAFSQVAVMLHPRTAVLL